MPLKVVFVSRDRSGGEFWEYFRSMPDSWLAVPYPENALRSEIAHLFNVEAIPTVVVIGPDGRVITADGRERILADPSGHHFPWARPVDDGEAKADGKEGPTLEKKEAQLIR